MDKITSTPFNEYREEQSGIKLTDYFVRPEFFDQLSDNKPKMIYGSRGTGKTTILKAMALDQVYDKEKFLKHENYIGVYYRTDLNISSAFDSKDFSADFWHKLYSYYFTCSITRALFETITNVKDLIGANEKNICKEVLLFYGFNHIDTLAQLVLEIKTIEKSIEIYLNNMPYQQPPKIGAFASMLRDIPKIIIDNCNTDLMKDKHFIYLIDEFESLKEYQQKAILSMVKYADQRHTYIIGLRPLGLKILSTIGDEYIRETDDYNTYILDSDAANYLTFAKKVCDKRLELFYKKYYPQINEIPTIDNFFEIKQTVDEIELLFNNSNIQHEHIKRVEAFLNAFEIDDESISDLLIKKQELFYFIVLKLIKERNRNTIITIPLIKNEVYAFTNPDRSHKDFIHNYRTALLFYILHLYSKNKLYSGFQTITNLSGHTLRYLLEMCNEIFLHMYREDREIYSHPHLIPMKIQSEEIFNVSQRRFEQIKSVPDIGPRMRQFMNTLGSLASTLHEDSQLAKFEPNHFSIRADTQPHLNIDAFLIECVFRGVLIQYEDNKIKVKNSISHYQFSYQIHPIYTPKFQISFRKKQKFDLSIDQISIMIGTDIKEINKLIRKYEKQTLSWKIGDIIEYLKTGKKSKDDSNQETLFDYYGQGD